MRVPTHFMFALLLAGIVEGRRGKSRSRSRSNYRSFIGDTTTPTFAPIASANTRQPGQPTIGISAPGASVTATYVFSTAPASFPTSNAQTTGPGSTQPEDIDTMPPTFAQTEVPTYSPTATPSTSTPTSRPTISPSYNPTMIVEAMLPSASPSVSETAGSSSVLGDFTTSPTMSAQTNPPHCENQSQAPIANAEIALPPTKAPTISYTSSPTMSSTSDSTTAPNMDVTLFPETSPTMSLTSDSTTAPNMDFTFFPETDVPSSETSTLLPSMPPILNAGTRAPGGANSTLPEGNTTSGNLTSSCSSDAGFFSLPSDTMENATASFEIDLLVFSYELETIPIVNASEVLPSLEIAFVDTILPVVFPFECPSTLSGPPTATISVNRFFETINIDGVLGGGITGISSVPDDEVAEGVECQTFNYEKNGCVIVNGKITIISTDGVTDETMDEIREALFDFMSEGYFGNSTAGIVRVSPAANEIDDESVSEPDNEINENQDNDQVETSNNRDSMLGIGLSLGGAAIILFTLGALGYRRKKSMEENDTTTLQEGATVTGLSRFDTAAADGAFSDVALSPAASRRSRSPSKRSGRQGSSNNQESPRSVL